jgi:osmotically-inducible protein OsmY
MNCARCGASNRDGARYCASCSVLLNPRAPGLASASALLPAPIRARGDTGLPIPQSSRLTERALSAIWPRASTAPASPLQAGAIVPPPRPAQPSAGSPPPPVAMSMANRIGWSIGGVLLCAALAFAAQQAVRRLSQWQQEWAVQGLSELVQPPAEVASKERPTLEPTPAINVHDLANAINAELHRLGVTTVEVRIAEDGTATATGRMASAADRDSLVQWLESLPAVARVVDEIALPPTEAAAPAPEPQPEATTRTDAEDAINAELRRAGFKTVKVHLGDDGTATVTGRLASAEDRDSVVEWLESLPGITTVDDDIALPPEGDGTASEPQSPRN